jgi:hypothetical protein
MSLPRSSLRLIDLGFVIDEEMFSAKGETVTRSTFDGCEYSVADAVVVVAEIGVVEEDPEDGVFNFASDCRSFVIDWVDVNGDFGFSYSVVEVVFVFVAILADKVLETALDDAVCIEGKLR